MTSSPSHTSIVLVDDHALFRKGMASLINGFPGYRVLYEASNGREFIKGFHALLVPEIILLDINMPHMDGYDTAVWIKENLPHAKILALSMYEDETAIIKMLKCGASGYLLKDTEPAELRRALDMVIQKGFYHSELTMDALVKTIHHPGSAQAEARKADITDREREFLRYASTELTYKEIADRMCLSVRTIDGYREALFEKLSVRSRVGLVLYAIRQHIVEV